jgi:DNA-binding NarL/FixJ family response regulator
MLERVFVGVVDDRPIPLTGLFSALALLPEVEIVGTCPPAEAAHLLRTCYPELLILAVDQDADRFRRLIKQSLAFSAALRIVTIVPTAHAWLGPLLEKAGVWGTIWDTDSPEQVANVVQRVSRGTKVKRKQPDVGWPESDALSDQQLAVLHLLASGASDSEMAAALGISVNTVDYHLKQLFQALGVHNRTGAILRGWQVGYLRKRIVRSRRDTLAELGVGELAPTETTESERILAHGRKLQQHIDQLYCLLTACTEELVQKSEDVSSPVSATASKAAQAVDTLRVLLDDSVVIPSGEWRELPHGAL